MRATSVTWIPAHPSYGSTSMRRYWNALDSSLLPEDPFEVHSLIRPAGESGLQGWRQKVNKIWHRKISYPMKISCSCTGRIVHVLDHSWSDMLAHVPHKIAKVVTIHDLIPLRFPGGLSESQIQRFRTCVSRASEADAVIADSVYTKREAVELLDIPEEQIHVVPCGVDLPDAVVHRSWIEEKISSADIEGKALKIGSIGSTLERKNLAIFPQALATYSAKDAGKAILIRAGAKLPINLAEDIRRILGPDGLIELGYLRDDELGNFYQSLDVMVVPSLYEGFGLPVIEAMAWKVPVIASRATSLPEVGGNNVIYFDPNDARELGEQLSHLRCNGLPDSWLSDAHRRASAFSWRASLDGIFSVYEIALERYTARSRGLRTSS